jgi:hypothetical protein
MAVNYVMVPVPEELAPKVLWYVSWKGHFRLAGESDGKTDAPRASVEAAAADGGGAIARAFARLDDPSRALAAVVATAALDQDHLTVPEAARRAGLTTREAVGTILELNQLIAAEGGPPKAVFIKDVERAAGESTWDAHILVVPEPIARPLADLTQAGAEG